MSYPSDYRYLPFTDASNYVQKVEYHQIPATSPFEVRLNEVPEKASPSTMTIKIVTGFSGGSPVYGATMTEVSATPASGEYYPDYYTEADGDSNWNTGTIQFNSANANTTIEVTYMATGGLASIKSNHYPSWMTDRGDGSDGVFAPTSNTTVAGGVKNYTTVNIPAGVTVTCSAGTLFKVQGAFVNNGIITANGAGGAGGGVSSAGATGDGGGNGGAGQGGWNDQAYPAGAGGNGYSYTNSMHLPVIGGAGGGGGGCDTGRSRGTGGNGGGVIGVFADSVINGGTITANGAAGQNVSGSGSNISGPGGGGGGGVIVICARSITQGTLTVNGGSGGSNTSTTWKAANGTAGNIITKELSV